MAAAMAHGPGGVGPSHGAHHPPSHQTIIQIYLEWANHYLQKGKSARRIQDLQEDLKDGVVLCDVVQAITNQRVPGVTRKPKNTAQMLENLENILIFLGDLGVPLDGVSPKDLREGQLKPILRLFFELSRFKQKDMSQAVQQPRGGSKGSSIPVIGHQGPPPPRKTTNQSIRPGSVSGNSSRSTSPSTPQQQSFIPMPRSTAAAAATQPTGRTLSDRDIGVTQAKTNPQEKNSMLQKLRLFKDKRATINPSTATGSNSKRAQPTTNAFTSAKSDSSISNDINIIPQMNHAQDKQKQSESQLKRRTDKSGCGVAASSESLPTNGNSFLRNPRTLSTNRDSRLRYSATGIPTRPTNNVNNNQPITAIPTITNHSQPITMIPQPKPTAAVKGHTKAQTTIPASSALDKTFFMQQKKRTRPDSKISTEASQVNTKKELKAIVAPMPVPSTTVPISGVDNSEDKNGGGEESIIKSTNHKLESSEDWEEDELLKSVIPMDVLPSLQRKSTYSMLGSPPFSSQLSIGTQPVSSDISFRDFLFNSAALDNTGRPEKVTEESFEESSSLSSGVSDLNEVPVDVNSVPDVSSPYASLRRLGKEEGRFWLWSQKELAGLDESHGTENVEGNMTGLREDFVDAGQSGKNDEWSRRSKLSFGYARTSIPSNFVSMNKGSLQQHIPHPRQEEGRLVTHGSLSQRPPTHLLPSSKGRTRTRVKVSGGTQTTNDLTSTQDYATIQSAKSLSLTSPTAAQLSESLRQRILVGSNSLPKGASADYTAILTSIQHQQHHLQQHRLQQQNFQQEEARRAKDRSFAARESPYAIYAELRDNYAYQSPNRHSSAYGSSAHSTSSKLNAGGGSLTEGESLESLNSTSSAATHNRDARARSRASAQNQCCQSRDSNGLNRSNSISHFCERTFPRSTKSEKIYPSMLHRTEEPALLFPSRTHGDPPSIHGTPTRAGTAYGITPNAQKNQPLRLSMSPYTGFGRPPKDDELTGSSLSLVSTASSIYSTNEEKQAHELRKLRRELQENHEKIHTLNNQLSTNAHVVAAFEQSLANMTHRLQTLSLTAEQKDSELTELRQTIELLKKQSIEAGLVIPRFNSGASRDGSPIGRQLSADSVSSINSISSATSNHSQTSVPVQQQPIHNNRPRGKGWLRSSFSKAFSRSKGGKLKDEEGRDERENFGGSIPSKVEPVNQPSSNSGEDRERSVDDLRKQLREKEMILTDIRLEALTSAHQLESMKETMAKMRSEMVSLRQENERLQRLVASKVVDNGDRLKPETFIDIELASPCEKEGKRVTVVVTCGQSESLSEVSIGKVCVSARTKWDLLDSLIRRLFKEYICRVDNICGLGLSPDSILSYTVGEVVRSREGGPPELLPCGYLVGDVNKIRITLKGATDAGAVDALAFQTLLHKQTLLRWIGCLTDSRRLLLSGVRGVGKSYLAHRLAEWLVSREGKEPSPESIPTFSAEGREISEMEEYFGVWANEWGPGDFPSVLIIENLQESFRDPFHQKLHQRPFIIATTAQPHSETNLLQTFRCVELSPYVDPLKGLVSRFLEQRLIEAECSGQSGLSELVRVFHWITDLHTKVNEQLEKGGKPPIGPRLFLSCPTDVDVAEKWFTNLWNKTLRPHLKEALSSHSEEQTQKNGESLSVFITRTFPWPSTPKIPLPPQRDLS